MNILKRGLIFLVSVVFLAVSIGGAQAATTVKSSKSNHDAFVGSSPSNPSDTDNSTPSNQRTTVRSSKSNSSERAQDPNTKPMPAR
jgi:hypothetical protein